MVNYKPSHGRFNPSPVKKRDKVKANTYVRLPGNRHLRAELQARLNARLRPAPPPPPAESSSAPSTTLDSHPTQSLDIADTEMDPLDNLLQHEDASDAPVMDTQSSYPTSEMLVPPTAPLPPSSTPRKPAQSAEETEVELNRRWREVLGNVMDTYCGYRNRSMGRVDPPVASFEAECTQGCAYIKHSEIQCFYYDHHKAMLVPSCACRPLPQVLINHGLFPTAPSQPRAAIAITLLDFYHALFERSCDAITALSNALQTMYMRRGFPLLDEEGILMQDPLRRGLSQAVQWFDCLLVETEHHVNRILDSCSYPLPVPPSTSCSESHPPSTPTPLSVPAPTLPNTEPSTLLHESRAAPSIPKPNDNLETPQPPDAEPLLSLKPGRCDPYLRRLCPSCFGGDTFGRAVEDGADIHVSVDGNLHHKHQKSAGKGVNFHTSTRFLNKDYVDTIGRRIDEARKRRPKSRKAKVPDEAVDACQHSYQAAQGEDKTTSSKIFDENGLMALVCRHDIPIFFASIDSPGEQQKYPVALLDRLYSMIPKHATVLVLYDIACVVDRSKEMYDIFPESIASRLTFATSVMHSYGHQWVCQLVYSPRMRKGTGLSDGEGTERLWSQLRRIIPLERRGTKARRIWLLDRQADAIAQEHRAELGEWIKRRLYKNILKKEAEADVTLERSGHSKVHLRRQWGLQQISQTSQRAHGPSRLKKELTKVLQLQTEIDSVETSLEATEKAVNNSTHRTKETMRIIRSLTATHEKLKAKAEQLYSSLKIPEQFPDLRKIPFEYLHTLLQARDVKIEVRRRAIGNFLEWDRLDSAVGGIHNAIGTKLHQITRKSITKRTPALRSALRKYNSYVEKLQELHRPEYSIPPPKPLPMELKALRDNSDLLEDVWVSTTDAEPAPAWLVDEKVRNGIRAVLAEDRCAEERRRLQMEANNLCQWFGEELLSIEKALESNQFSKYHPFLKQRQQIHLHSKTRWANPLMPISYFDYKVSLVRSALHATSDTGQSRPPTPPPHSYPPSYHDDVEDDIPTADELYLADMMDKTALESSDEEDETPNNDADIDDERAVGTREVGNIEAEDVVTSTIVEDVEVEDVEVEDVDGMLPVELIWRLPTNLNADYELRGYLDAFQFHPVRGSIQAKRVFRSTTARIIIGNKVLERLSQPKAWLNDECINDCAALLQEVLSFPGQPSHSCAPDCAVLTTFTTNTRDIDALWRHTRKTLFWEKSRWILPIHDENHWIVAVIKPSAREILIFDSFGSHDTCMKWTLRIHQIARDMIQAAWKHDKLINVQLEGWVARPSSLLKRQTNSYDCGVWVLTMIAAALRGFDIGEVKEDNIDQIRQFLYRLVLSLEPYSEDSNREYQFTGSVL